MKSLAIASLLLGLAAGYIFGLGLETEELQAVVESLYRSAGRAMPSVSLPATPNELRHAVELLLNGDLPPDIRDETSELARALSRTEASGEVSAELSFSPEYYLNIGRSTFGDQVDAEDPMAMVGLGYGYSDGPYLFTEAVLQREWQYVAAPTNIPVPVEGNPLPFENNLMHVGYFYLPVGATDITVGRQRVSIGPNRRDSLLVSSRIPFLDAIKITMSLGSLKMTSITSTLDNGQAQPDTEIVVDPQYAFDKNTIFYNVHYFEYAWSKIRAGIGAQVLLARRMNNFHLGDFFPVFTWHNADIVPNNMSLLLDLTYVPVPNLSVYGQVGWDEISGESFGIADSGLPTIDAYIVGASFEVPHLRLSASVTGGYTHYLWGNFDLNDFLARAIYRLESDGSHESMPLTSPHGPGALWLDTGVSIGWSQFTGTLSYLLLGTVPGANLYTTAYEASDALKSARRDWRQRVTVSLSYDILDLAHVTLAPGLTVADGIARFQLEATGSISKRFSRQIGR